jgi:hypothetical protein
MPIETVCLPTDSDPNAGRHRTLQADIEPPPIDTTWLHTGKDLLRNDAGRVQADIFPASGDSGRR